MIPTTRQRFPLSWAGVAVPGGNAAVRTARLPPGTRVIPLPREDAAPLAELSIHDRGDVVVVSLRGELDLLSATVLQVHLSDIRCRGWPRSVADLTGLAFIDCACLSVLVRHCKEIRGRGGSFALAGSQCAVLRILAVTGLLGWFEVHDTVEDAVTGTGTQRSAIFLATPSGSRPRGVPVIHGGRSRVIPEVSMSHGSAVAADRGPDHGGAAVPAPGWLS